MRGFSSVSTDMDTLLLGSLQTDVLAGSPLFGLDWSIEVLRNKSSGLLDNFALVLTTFDSFIQ